MASFHIVLMQPEIPPNTGNIGRLCLGANATLHLIKPLGFSLDDRALKRAGLDYWQEVDCRVWDALEDCLAAMDGDAKVYYLTTKTSRAYWSVAFQPGDCLVFGPESRGLPASLLEREKERCLTIPMQGTRSLNLATSVGIVLWEGLRQTQMAGAQAKRFTNPTSTLA